MTDLTDIDLKTFVANVPCNGCRKCCQGGEVIRLSEEQGDDPAGYETVMGIDEKTGAVDFCLKQKPNGDCIYLGENGCTIYERRPSTCRVFDCRFMFLSNTRAARKEMDGNRFELMTEGKKRVHTMTHEEKQMAIKMRNFRTQYLGSWS